MASKGSKSGKSNKSGSTLSAKSDSKGRGKKVTLEVLYMYARKKI
jgi:hypothetical protein